ncbi:hypothetical protein D3C81_1902460 [compost metagenome]
MFEASRPGAMLAVLVRSVFSAPAKGCAALANRVRVTVLPAPAGKSPSRMQRMLLVPEQFIAVTEAAPLTLKVSPPSTAFQPLGRASVTRTWVVGDTPLLRTTMRYSTGWLISTGDCVTRVLLTTSRSVAGMTVVVCTAVLLASSRSA